MRRLENCVWWDRLDVSFCFVARGFSFVCIFGALNTRLTRSQPRYACHTCNKQQLRQAIPTATTVWRQFVLLVFVWLCLPSPSPSLSPLLFDIALARRIQFGGARWNLLIMTGYISALGEGVWGLRGATGLATTMLKIPLGAPVL